MEYSEKDMATSKLKRIVGVHSAGAHGREFFSDVDSKSARGPKSESPSRKTLDHIQGHGRTSEHTDQTKMSHVGAAKNQRKAMNLKPKSINRTRFKT
jgi:hypothetical protein